MGDTLNIHKIVATLKKSCKMIILLTIVAVAATAAVSYYLLTPIYGSSTQILVSQEQTDTNSLSSQSIEADLQLINTYRVIIRSPLVLDQVIEQLGLTMTIEELEKNIVVTSASGSQVLDLTVMHEDAATAVSITNTTSKVFETEVRKLLNINNVTILSQAVLRSDPVPIAPNSMLNTAMAAAIGLMLGVGIAFLREYVDTTIKNEEDIEELLGAPILAVISPIPDRKQGKEAVQVAVKEKEVIKYG